MKNIPVSLHRRKLLPAIPVLLYFINLQYVYRNIFIKNNFFQRAILFFSKYIFVKRRTVEIKKESLSKKRNSSLNFFLV
ncbi:hypothetical protein HMPREF6123_2262 [Oribacterium sinus F0268]|uniref:Uncharacterized protein n=1 Tax=Oribacterium sinus F0268 TaxID=585501 RepID=C2L0J3_9FIRM|nr:hypothetical protein HMPREF6123_2262 [Oribacterium sinus F0268]